MPGIEPGASHMRSERSTTELHPHIKCTSQYKVFLIYNVYKRCQNIRLSGSESHYETTRQPYAQMPHLNVHA